MLTFDRISIRLSHDSFKVAGIALYTNGYIVEGSPLSPDPAKARTTDCRRLYATIRMYHAAFRAAAPTLLSYYSKNNMEGTAHGRQ